MITEISLHPVTLHRHLPRAEQHTMVVNMAQSRFDLASTGGQLEPAFAAYCPFGMRDVPGPAMGFAEVPWSTPEEKHHVMRAIRAVFHDINATRYSFWCEAWFVTGSKREGILDAVVSERADRQEMLFVITIDKEFDEPLITDFRIVRPWDGGMPTLEPMEGKAADSTEGALMDLLG